MDFLNQIRIDYTFIEVAIYDQFFWQLAHFSVASL